MDGTVGVSGVLRGRVTLYSNRGIVLLDDLRYATDPASGRCNDSKETQNAQKRHGAGCWLRC